MVNWRQMFVLPFSPYSIHRHSTEIDCLVLWEVDKSLAWLNCGAWGPVSKGGKLGSEHEGPVYKPC